MTMRWKGRLAALLLACAPLAATQAQTAVPPAAAFFERAQIREVQLSPSGRWLMMLVSLPDGRGALKVVDLEGKAGASLIQPPDHFEIAEFDWVDDDWSVYRYDNPDDKVSSRVKNGLVALKRDGSDARKLIAHTYKDEDAFKRQRGLPPDHGYAGLLSSSAGEVLVDQWHWDVKGEFSHITMKAVNVRTGDARTLDGNAPQGGGVWVDRQGRVRLVSRVAGDKATLFWSEGDGKWREIASQPRMDQAFWPAYVDDQGLVVAAENSEGVQLRRFDLEAGKPAAEPLLSTPGFNGTPFAIRAPATRAVVGLRALLEAPTTAWLQPAMTRIQAAVDAKLPGQINVVSCPGSCEDPALVLVYSFSAFEPGLWAVYRPKQDQWQLVGRRRPAIEPQRMGPVTLVRFPARDGLQVPLWITRPAGADPGKPLPTVVLVHGGPNVRGHTWHWDAEAQFLASRGYLVLQPEFRGSDGYSSRLERAGWKQWGLAMQDDLTDALRYAAAQGWADDKRACIMGASYGGYAALEGLVKDPDLYRCGIAFAAVSDPRYMFDFHWNDISSDVKQYSLTVTLGDPKTDDAKFAATSPVVQAGRIKAPVLLVHGASDQRVPIANAERMREALARNGRPFEWKVYDNEGHGFLHPENEIDYYQRVEAFLAKYLK